MAAGSLANVVPLLAAPANQLLRPGSICDVLRLHSHENSTDCLSHRIGDVRRIIETLVAKRDERRDGFAKVVHKAMKELLGTDADEVRKLLAQRGISRSLAKQATEIAAEKGRFTIFSLVDALTRLTREVNWIGDRTEMDGKVASLLALAV
jgi:hypothetical protein